MSKWDDPARGPFVIVNMYARTCWHKAPQVREEYATYREAHAARNRAKRSGDLRLITLAIDEARIMSLAQFLVEFGQ